MTDTDLNRKLAEELGYRVELVQLDFGSTSSFQLLNSLGNVVPQNYSQMSVQSAWHNVERFYTDAKAVFDSGGLVAQMRAKGFTIALMEFPFCDPPRWSACFEDHSDNTEWVAYGTTAMEAAARAALFALRHEEEAA